MGPGIVGTATRLGFSGIEVGPILDAAVGLQGTPIACLRTSFADPRERHRGISHHSATALTIATRSSVLVPIATVGGDEERHLRKDLDASGIAARHEVVDVAPVGIVELMEGLDLNVVSMGRPARRRPGAVRDGRRGRSMRRSARRAHLACRHARRTRSRRTRPEPARPAPRHARVADARGHRAGGQRVPAPTVGEPPRVRARQGSVAGDGRPDHDGDDRRLGRDRLPREAGRLLPSRARSRRRRDAPRCGSR